MIFLDFDGVIVDSVKEAYAIAMIAQGRVSTLDDIDFSGEHYQAFLQQRCYVGPAWHYFYLLKAIDEGKASYFKDIVPCEAGEDARDFQQQFFATRQRIKQDNWDKWLVLNELYSGSEAIIELINRFENIAIVTTKDQATVRALLDMYGVTRDIAIYDTKYYEEFGCKSLFIDDYIKKYNIAQALFVDDSMGHLEKCSWVDNLDTMQAKWGYVLPSVYEDNKQAVVHAIQQILEE